MRTSKPFIKNRNKLGASKPIFVPNLVPGNSLKDVISQTGAVVSISGARWGIVNGVVAQFAANVPPVEDKGLRGCPAFTQFCTHTESLATSWAQSNLSIVETPSFQGVSMHKLIENTANAPHGLTRSAFATADSSIIGFRCKCKSDGRDFQLKALLKTNSWVALCRVDFGSGTIVNKHASVKASNILSIDDGFYDVFVAYDVGIGTSDPRLFPELHNGVSEIYTGNGVSGIYFAQPTMVNYGVNGTPFIPPYVPNNTGSSVSVVSEAATATTGTSFDLDAATLSRLKAGLRGPNAQGHIELEFESNVDSGWFTSYPSLIANIFTVNNSPTRGCNIYRYDASSVVIRCVGDGIPSSAEVYTPIAVGQTFKISIDYGTYTDGTQKMRLTVNGVKSSVVAFSGSFGAQDLKFFYGALVHAFFIKLGSFKFVPKPIW